jgi:hypothetical protein
MYDKNEPANAGLLFVINGLKMIFQYRLLPSVIPNMFTGILHRPSQTVLFPVSPIDHRGSQAVSRVDSIIAHSINRV